MQILKIITLSNDFMEFSNSFYLIPKIETDSKKWSQMTILMLFCSYRRCTSSKIGERKMSKIQIFENKAWKCGGPWGFFLQRFFKHFQYVPILAQMSTSAEAAVEFLPKNVENGFFFREGFWGEICLFEPCCEESRRLIRTRGAGGGFACTPKSKRTLNHRKIVPVKNLLFLYLHTRWFVEELNLEPKVEFKFVKYMQCHKSKNTFRAF